MPKFSTAIGALLDHEDNVLAYLNDSTIEDRFTLKQLLEAADVNLDALCMYLIFFMI
jgi:hypothetical protein